jgi:hypothetical protein
MTTELKESIDNATQLMRSHGAIIYDPVNITGADQHKSMNDLFSLFLMTFSEDIASYLAELTNTTIRSLIDLIEFNLNHTNEEFHPQFAPNQHVFEWSNKFINLSYVNQSSLLNKTRLWGGQLGIDAA